MRQIRSYLGAMTAVTMLGASLLFGCATAPNVQLAEGTPYTLSYVNEKGEKETVYDLNGDWDAVYDHKPGGVKNDIVKISQEGSTFVGVNMVGNPFLPKGYQALKGILQGNGFREAYAWNADRTLDSCWGQIGSHNTMDLYCSGSSFSVTISLRRK